MPAGRHPAAWWLCHRRRGCAAGPWRCCGSWPSPPPAGASSALPGLHSCEALVSRPQGLLQGSSIQGGDALRSWPVSMVLLHHHVHVNSMCNASLCPYVLCSTQRCTAGTQRVSGGMPVKRATRTTSYRVASPLNTHLYMHQRLCHGTPFGCNQAPLHSMQPCCDQKWHTKRTELQ